MDKLYEMYKEAIKRERMGYRLGISRDNQEKLANLSLATGQLWSAIYSAKARR